MHAAFQAMHVKYHQPTVDTILTLTPFMEHMHRGHSTYRRHANRTMRMLPCTPHNVDMNANVTIYRRLHLTTQPILSNIISNYAYRGQYLSNHPTYIVDNTGLQYSTDTAYITMQPIVHSLSVTACAICDGLCISNCAPYHGHRSLLPIRECSVRNCTCNLIGRIYLTLQIRKVAIPRVVRFGLQ